MKKSKFLALMLAGTMMFSIAACSKEDDKKDPKDEDTKVEETEKESSSKDEDKKDKDEDTKETEPEETEPEIVLPELKSSIYDLDYELVGYEFTDSYESGVSAIRLYFNCTNNSDSIQYPHQAFTNDRLLAFQGEEELNGCMADEPIFPDQIYIYDIWPGVSCQFCEVFKMVDNDAPVDFIAKLGDDSIVEFTLDPSMEPVIPESVEIVPINDPTYLPNYTEITDTTITDKWDEEIVYTVLDIQAIDGLDWMSRNKGKVVRITYEVVNGTDKEKYISGAYSFFQDGVELQLGHPETEDETDIDINIKVEAGATVTISKTYFCFNTESPVYMVYESSYPKAINVMDTGLNLK